MSHEEKQEALQFNLEYDAREETHYMVSRSSGSVACQTQYGKADDNMDKVTCPACQRLENPPFPTVIELVESL